MNRGKVLLICYYFPPLGLAGVTRPLNLFKYLPQHGYECHVLTVKPVAYRKYEPELLDGLDQSKIFRAGSRDPQRLMYLLGIREVNPRTIERGAHLGETLFPDSKVGWVAPAVRLGRKLHDRHGYKAIISTSPPVSAHLIAMRLAEQIGVPWMADFRDMWTIRPIDQSYHSEQNIAKATTLLAAIRNSAAKVIGVNQSVADYLGAHHIVSNGADPELARLWAPPGAGDDFGIAVLGSLSDSSPLEPLLKVLAVLRDCSPQLFERVRLMQVGMANTNWLLAQLERYSLKDRCTIHGLRPRQETVRLLSTTAMMYLGLAPDIGQITTARIFDMLVSGRPVLASVENDTDLARLIRQTGNGMVFDKQSTGAAAQYVGELVQKQIDGSLSITPVPDYARPYLWDNLAGEYARLLDEVLA